jgi:hypothetical protein
VHLDFEGEGLWELVGRRDCVWNRQTPPIPVYQSQVAGEVYVGYKTATDFRGIGQKVIRPTGLHPDYAQRAPVKREGAGGRTSGMGEDERGVGQEGVGVGVYEPVLQRQDLVPVRVARV